MRNAYLLFYERVNKVEKQQEAKKEEKKEDEIS